MIFLKSRSCLYLRVPKTASTSLSLQIVDKIQLQPGDFYTAFGSPTFGHIEAQGFNHVVSRKGTKDVVNDEHLSIKRALEFGIFKEKELESLQIYGFLRNPLDRFFSVFIHLFHLGYMDVTKMTKEEIAARGIDILNNCRVPYEFEMISSDNSPLKFPLLPQSHWLTHRNKPINNIVLYPNFDQFLKVWTGSSKLKYKEKISNKPIHSEVGSDLIDQIHHWYAKDFELWERFSQP